MIEHPILLTATEQEKNNNVWAANLFVLWSAANLFMRPKTKELASNPITQESFEKRYYSIMNDFRDKTSAQEFIFEAKNDFNNYYQPDGAHRDAFLEFQEKSIPYFDMQLAKRMVRTIHLSESRHPEYYSEDHKYKKTKSGQWLSKYLARRYPVGMFAQGYYFIDSTSAGTYWELLSRQLKTDVDEINHYLQMLARPDMKHARTIDFNKGSIPNLIVKLKKVTEEISARTMKKEKASLMEQQSPSEVLLQLEDGWKWVKIKDSYNGVRDDVEAQLMGHCATPEWENSYLISLRDSKGEPWVTATIKELTPDIFILGQVKGRGIRNTPPQKFEPQILSLFLMPQIVKQVLTDSYDWGISKFSKSNAELIIASKPYFNNNKKLGEYFPVKKLIKMMKGAVEGDGRLTVEKNGDVWCMFSPPREFLRTHTAEYNRHKQKKEYPWWLDALEDGHLEVDFSPQQSESVEWFIDEILTSKEGKIIYEAIIQELEKEGQDIEDYDDYKDVLKQAFHYGDSLAASLEGNIGDSIRSSYESSIFSQLEGELQGFFEKIHEKLDHKMELVLYDPKTKKEQSLDAAYYHSESIIYVKLPLYSAIDLWSANNLNSALIDSQIDQTVEEVAPVYWKNVSLDDYSSEYALENFNEQFKDDLVEQAKKILKTKSKAKKKNPSAPALRINNRQLRWIEDVKYPLAITHIHPLDFINLTTESFEELEYILDKAHPLEFYNSDKINGDMVVHPFLEIGKNGEVIAHEGRHRAAALYNAGSVKMPVVIFGRYSNKKHRVIFNRHREDQQLKMGGLV